MLQIFVFAVWACFCLAVVNKLDIGLDQTLSMPSDSYVIGYLSEINKYLSTGMHCLDYSLFALSLYLLLSLYLPVLVSLHFQSRKAI